MSRELRHYEYVNHPYERVRSLLLSDAAGVFQRATVTAVDRAKSVAAQLKVNVGAMEIGTGIAIHVAAVEDGVMHPALNVAMTRLRLEWKAAHAAGLFPAMHAELSVYPLSTSETQLDLHGKYDPPLGAVGSAVDAVLMHRVAEASVHRFLKDVCEELRREIG
jgi:hypothetical protein